MVTYLPDIDYMANFTDWLTLQNGDVTGLHDRVDPQLRYQRNGRDLAAFTTSTSLPSLFHGVPRAKHNWNAAKYR